MDFYSQDEIDESRRRWEKEFVTFCHETSSLFRDKRQLPIRESAIHSAEQWIAKIVGEIHGEEFRRLNRTVLLLLVGDEQLEEACCRTSELHDLDFQFIFDVAYQNWSLRHEHDPVWWTPAYWAINNPDDIIEFARLDGPLAQIKSREAFLLTESYCGSGSFSLCTQDGNGLHVKRILGWEDS